MKINKQIRNELDTLSKSAEYRNRTNDSNYFKEEIKTRNLSASVIRNVSKKYFNEIKGLNKKEIFDLAEDLMKSGYNDEHKIACDWVFRLKKHFDKQDFDIFENWLKYIDNWAKCDDFCTHALGYLFLQQPDKIINTKKWTKSTNKWLRRSSAVIYIYPNKQRKFIKEAFEIADILLQDNEDLVQKGYGWMLKEISNLYPEKVFEYVMINKQKMPRTALRYAIEKLPQNKRKEAMVINNYL